MIFRAEDDGYAVLEVQEAESRRGLRPGRPGRPPRRRRPGRSQRRVADPRPLRPPAAGPGGAAARPRRPRGPGRLPDLAAPHRPGPGRAAGRRARRGACCRRSPPTRSAVFGSLRGVSADQAAAATESWHASRAVRDLHVQLAPHGLAHLAAPIHARYGERSMTILHEDPYRLTEVDGRRLRPRRQDRPRRRRAAGVQPPRPGRRRLRPGRGRAAGQQLPAAGGADPAHGAADRPRPRPRGAGRGAAGCWSTEGRVYRELTHASELAVAATLRAPRSPRPPHLDHDPGETPAASELTDEQWAAVRGAFASRVSVLTGGPGVGKTVCTKEIVAEAEGGQRDDRPLRPDRPRRAAAGGGDRARGADDPPPAGVDAGPRAGLPARATRCRSTW